MRTPIQKTTNGLEARGIAGTYVVLLAMNCPKAYRKGLLGFGILRKDHVTGESVWLRGLKRFDLPASTEGDDVSTHAHPVQKFHWGDYTAKPGQKYTYTIHAFKGKPGALTVFEQVDLEVTTENPESIGKNGHAVHFNRTVAASQAFSRRFPSLPKGEVTDPNARAWLSRGLAESLIKFIDETKAGEGLHLFIYEFEKEEYFEALQRAKKRGVKLEILHDAIIKDGKGPSLEADPLIKKFGLSSVTKGRNGPGIGISHNKFMVRTTKAGKPTIVWTGSTNFTDSGVYAQANVGHVVADAKVAAAYFEWHQDIFKAPDMNASDSRKLAMQISTVPAGSSLKGTQLVLSPRTNVDAIDECAKLVGAAKRMVCFTAPFALHDTLENALEKAPAQVFGLLNKDGVVGKALHEAKNTLLAATGAIDEKSVLEAWQGEMLKESLHHSGVYVHTKFILIDPVSDNPLVISGSANFSNNSSKNNDENQLFIGGETEVADVYLGEFMRIFDHYYFRDVVGKISKKKGEVDGRFLKSDSSWTDDYFNGTRDVLRLAFF